MELCSHCGLPLSATPVRTAEAAYCCYGCRMVAELVGPGAAPDADDPHRALRYRFFAGALLAGFVMALSLAISTGYGFAELRVLRHDLGPAHGLLLLLTAPALVLLGTPVVRGAWHDLRDRRLTLNVLFTLGTASAVGVSLVSYARGTGPVYLETAVLLLALYTLGRYLEARAKGEAAQVLHRLLALPDVRYTRLAPDPGPVTADTLRTGDRIALQAGDVAPVDGLVREGWCFVDARSLTGEAHPAAKAPGDAVFAGTVLQDGRLVVEATATGTARRLARIDALVQTALARPPRLAAATDRILRWLVPAIVMVALVTFGGWYLTAGYEKALYAALSVVLIACPCALGLAIPLTLVVAHGVATRQGVVVRSGDALLDLAAVRAVAFDKTGTLTRPDAATVRLVLPQAALAGTDAEPPPDLVPDAETLLRWAAGLEAAVDHPLARALRQAAPAAPPAQHVRVHPGLGLTGEVADGGLPRRLALGSEQLARTLGLPLAPSLLAAAQHAQSQGLRVLHLFVEGEQAALVLLDEQPRPEAAAALRMLRDDRLAPHVLTGDPSASAQRLGDRLGLPVETGLTPEEKLAALRRLQTQHGPVAVVGDGLNDAAALAAADVGIALASGAGASLEAAALVLYAPDLRVVPWLVRLARRTRQIVRQNLAWTFGYNAVGLGLAVAGLLHPLVAMGIMVLSSGLVTANAFRLRRVAPPVLP